MVRDLGWLALTAVWGLGGIAAIFPAAMTPMLFDAPGSQSSALTIALAASIGILPVLCFSGAGLPWLFRRWRFAKGLFLLPAIDLAAIALLLTALGYLCDGQFSCGHQ
jgi:amino acid transporter